MYNFYKNYIFAYIILSGIITSFASFFQLRDQLTQISLLFFFVIDLGFITSFVIMRDVKFERIEVFLIVLILFSLFRSIFFGQNEISRRIITDITNPVFFLFKIAIIRNYLPEDVGLDVFIKKGVKYLFVTSILIVSLLMVLGRYIFIYAGFTPPVEFPFSFYLINGNIFYGIITFIVIVLSGKRSYLLASLVVLIIYFLSFNKRSRLPFIIVSGFLIVLLFISIPFFLNYENGAIGKYAFTINTFRELEIDFNDEKFLESVDLISGGRLAEITNSVKNFSFWDNLFGRGPGFTYSYENSNPELTSESYSNVHFTPINLFTKYGLVFSILFLSYLVKATFISSENKLHIFFQLTLIMYLIEMLFSYNIFVEPLIPFCLAFLKSKINK
jgi:hypothetical protein